MSKSLSLLVLKRHFFPALATFVAAIGASIAYLAHTPPRYETSARLMINEGRVSVSELGQALSEFSDTVPGGANPIATQAELVKSERVLERALAIAFPQENHPQEDNSQENHSQENNSSVQSLPTLDELRGDLQVNIIPATNIFELSYQNPDPELAATLVNAIAKAMEQENTDSIRLEASSVRKFLEAEVPQQQARLREAEAQESQYRQSSGLVASETQTDTLVESLATTEDQEHTLFAQLQEARTRDSLLRQVTGVTALKDAYATARAGQDEGLVELRNRLLELEATVVDSRSRLGDQHPDLLAVLQQRDEMRALYAQRLALVLGDNQNVPPGTEAADAASQDLILRYIVGEVERTALESRLKAVQGDRRDLTSRITELPAKQQQLTVLVRQREEEEEALKLLQSKLNEARIAEAQLVNNVQIIDLAEVPLAPAVPKSSVVFVVAIAAGTVLAISVILLLELMNNTIRTAAEAEALLKVPVLGTLPKVPMVRNYEQLEQFLDSSALVEPYRMLLKAIELRGNNKHKVILVSSIVPGEGKSNVVARLSAVAAMLSRRTLAIDADLHQPLQLDFFNLSARPGLTDVVVSGNQLSNATQHPSLENLSVLTHGQRLTRPSMALETANLKTLIADAATHHDLVFIDTSPASDWADAMTLSQYADGLVLIIRPGFTPREAALRTLSSLQGSGASILGIVSNETPDPASKASREVVEGDRPSSPIKRLTSFGSPAMNSKSAPSTISENTST